MSSLKYSGNAERMTVTLGAGYTAGSGTMSLASGHGARLPANGDFYLVPKTGTYQVFKVTARSTDTLTVTGSIDGTTDTSIAAGVELEWNLTASALTQLKADVALQSGTYASRPAAGTAGRSYLCTDFPFLSLDNGSSWVNMGPLFPMGSVDISGFSWVNQGGASETASGPGLVLSAPLNAGASFRLRVKSVPATPYTITLTFIPSLAAVNYQRFGLFWRQSSDGKLALFYYVYNSGWQIHYDRFSDTNGGGGSAVKSINANYLPVMFLRITEDSTNRTMFYSIDGINWVQFYQETRTTYITADQFGYMISEESNTYPASVLITGLTQA